MRPSVVLPARALPVLALIGCTFVATGCSATRFGSELVTRPKPLSIKKTESTTLHVPQDEPFSIALPRASREPGLGGSATSDASTKSSGEAVVSATVEKTGNAAGMFQLGHGFQNDTDRQLDLEFTVKFHCEFGVKQEPEVGVPAGTVGLRLYARDDRGRLARDITLVDQTTEAGAQRQEVDRSVNFTLTLGPGGTLDVYLAGQATVQIAATGTTAVQSASTELKLSGLQLEVVTHPAPAVGTTTNAAP